MGAAGNSRPMRLLLLLPLTGVLGCATLTGARPLDRGQHEIGASLGGGMVMLGDSPIPLPNVLVQGRSGIAAPLGHALDLNYGLDLTGLAFGVVPVEVGADWLLLDQGGAIPAVALTDRVWAATNAPGLPFKSNPELEFWGMDQIEVDASWLLHAQLVYVGVAEYLDFAEPKLALSPALGARFDPSPAHPGGLQIQAETRWYGVNLHKDLDTVRWVGGGQGIFGASLGVSWILGGAR